MLFVLERKAQMSNYKILENAIGNAKKQLKTNKYIIVQMKKEITKMLEKVKLE